MRMRMRLLGCLAFRDLPNNQNCMCMHACMQGCSEALCYSVICNVSGAAIVDACIHSSTLRLVKDSSLHSSHQSASVWLNNLSAL